MSWLDNFDELERDLITRSITEYNNHKLESHSLGAIVAVMALLLDSEEAEANYYFMEWHRGSGGQTGRVEDATSL